MGGPGYGTEAATTLDQTAQGYTESPALFGQTLEGVLQSLHTPPGVQITQYADDLLVSGEEEDQVREVTINLLNFLSENGLRVSKHKLQFVEKEVRYLGHILGQGSHRLSPERVAGILSLPPLRTKQEVRKLLGLIEYCRIWVEGYTQAVKFFY